MSDSDYRRLMAWLDVSLDIFRAHEGRLAVRDIRLQSLLAVLREEVAAELAQRRLAAGFGDSTLTGDRQD
jgi:hypothetical protein